MAYLTGTSGDDTLVGTEGVDTLASSAGTDILSGFDGNDIFAISGGGTVYVDDVVGIDTIDASGASSAVIDLTPGGATSQVGGATVNLSRPASGSKVDVFLLEDLSGSFWDDLASVQRLVPSMVSAIGGTGTDAAFGVGSFIDKPVTPFGSYGDYVYRTDLAVTGSAADLQNAVNALRIGSGYDVPESQIEALLQVARRAETNPTEIGFRDGALRTVVLMTDAPFHAAGDGSASGLSRPNNADGVVDANEDYPTIAQLRDALAASGIVPIFAVTSDVTETYRSLVGDLGRGVVVQLSEDSRNLTEVLTSGISAARNSLIENATGGTGADTLTGNYLANTLTGGAGNDTLTGGASIVGGNGDDYLNGGAGTDVAVFNGTQSQYVVTRVNPTTYTVLDTVSGRDGLDTVVDVETLRFSDGELSIITPPPVVTPVDRVGNTVGSTSPRPYDFGTMRTSGDAATGYSEYVGGGDVDYYRFVLQTRSTLNATLGDMSGDANLQLRNTLDRILAQSTTRGTDNETINRTLDAGTYYLSVNDAGADTPYRLSLAATAIDIDPDGHPVDMGVLLSAPRTMTDHIGESDTDTYRFNVNATANVRFNLSGFDRGDRAGANVQLLNAAGTSIIQQSNTTGVGPDTFSRSVPAGTYLVRVVPDRGADTDYTLTLNATVRDGAGNTTDRAFNLGRLATGTPRRASDAVGDGDAADVYRFNVTARSTINGVLSGMTGDADVALLDSTGAELQASATTGSGTETVTDTIDAGVYYLRVSDRGLDTAYTINLTAVPVDTVGDTLATARNLGTPVSGRPLSSPRGEVVVGADIDLYKFTIASSGAEIAFALSGMTADADMALLDSSGEVIQESSVDGSAAERFSRDLEPGTYYARISSNGGRQTAYNFSMTASAADNAGNTRETAYNTGILLPTASRASDTTSRSTSDIDYYKFTVGANAAVTIALSGIARGADIDFSIENSAGTTLRSTDASSDSLTETLSPGDYYVRVSPRLGESAYSISLSAIPSDNGANTSAEPTDLGRLRRASSEQTAQDFVGSRDQNDWWQVTVEEGVTLDLTATLSGMSPSSNVRLELTNVEGEVLTGRTINAPGGTVAEEDVGMGIYYIHVQAGGADTNYTLTVNGGSTTSTTPAARVARMAAPFANDLTLDAPLSGSASAALAGADRSFLAGGLLAAA